MWCTQPSIISLLWIMGEKKPQEKGITTTVHKVITQDIRNPYHFTLWWSIAWWDYPVLLCVMHYVRRPATYRSILVPGNLLNLHLHDLPASKIWICCIKMAAFTDMTVMALWFMWVFFFFHGFVMYILYGWLILLTGFS